MNLGRILCKSQSSPMENHNFIKKCNSPRCEICDMLILSNTLKMENGKIHHIKHDMSCNSLFVIYYIKCQFCPLSYIGETDNFRSRVNLHKSNTKNEANRNLKVNKHIHFCSKNKFSITPIFKCKNDDYVYRKEMESVFINSYCPSLNSNS